MHGVTQALVDALGQDAVLLGQDARERRPPGCLAPTLLLPSTTEQVSRALAICHAAHQPVVLQGGMTGLVDGALSRENELALSLSRMRRVEEVDRANRCLTAQAGVPLEAAQTAAREVGLMLPLDLGARGSATIGGNLATNAGGTRVLRYGMAREMVLGLEAVLADGTVLDARRKVIKDNAGYDLKQLFIGSEGTLGVVTRAVLRLRRAPRRRDVALVALDGFEAVTRFLELIEQQLGDGLSAFEVMWRGFYELVTTPPAKGEQILERGHSHYVLVEVAQADATGHSGALLEALENARIQGVIANGTLAQTQEQRRKIWSLRDDVEQLRRHGPVHGYDVSLALDAMEDYVRRVEQALAASFGDHRCDTFGHVADGNLHLAVWVAEQHSVAAVDDIVYGLLPASSSVSAEHGIGLLKKSRLVSSRSAPELALMRTLKRALDPRGILNPGRVFDVG